MRLPKARRECRQRIDLSHQPDGSRPATTSRMTPFPRLLRSGRSLQLRLAPVNPRGDRTR